MAQTRIEEIINELYSYIESVRPGGFNQSKITVQKDEIYNYLDELRLHIPDEIKRCQKIIANRENIMKKAEADAKVIIDNANEKAKQIIEDGEKHAQQLIEETEIYNGAYEQAHKMTQEAKEERKKTIQNAKDEAEKIVADADKYQVGVKNYMMSYAEDVFDAVESVVANAYKEAKDSSDRLIKVLKENLAKVQQSQDELREAQAGSDNTVNVNGSGGGSDGEGGQFSDGYYGNTEDDGDFDFPEGTFDPKY